MARTFKIEAHLKTASGERTVKVTLEEAVAFTSPGVRAKAEGLDAKDPKSVALAAHDVMAIEWAGRGLVLLKEALAKPGIESAMTIAPVKDQFVIRSMSTTDAVPGQPIEQYHIYLLKPEKRAGAYWRQDMIDAMRFDSVDEALEHGKAALRDDRFDVVPSTGAGVPTYWDARKADYRSRVIGSVVVIDETKPPRESLGL